MFVDLAFADSVAELTDKQRQILAMLAEAMTIKEMARELGVSPSAVNQRLHSIRSKLGPLGRSDLARLHRDFRQGVSLGSEDLINDRRFSLSVRNVHSNSPHTDSMGHDPARYDFVVGALIGFAMGILVAMMSFVTAFNLLT